ncbi:cation-translocating P-type ATPase [Spirosoma flavum]|uniref:Cation-translocating P-type ATPase n=1 Tax=Spirosoma flavum TaxID=2048557 RepID=A0ABW6AGD3_9BACT
MMFLQAVGWLHTGYMFLAIALLFVALLPGVRNLYKVKQLQAMTDPLLSNPATDGLSTFWALPASDVLTQLHTLETGLSHEAARKIQRIAGLNQIKPQHKLSGLGLFFSQFKSPISLILIGAATLSFFLSDFTDGSIILVIILISGLLGFWQEQSASHAMQQLQSIVVAKTTTRRDGKEREPDEQLVPGDVLMLRSGDLVPADCYLLSSNELFVNEATLTGETFPVDKLPGVQDAATPLAKRQNTLFMGSSVVSGSGTAVVVHTGLHTELGHIAERINTAPPETDFEHGIQRFGYLLMEIPLVLVILIFAINVFLHKPVLDAFLFSLAIAVGLTPQLLPAIISINLAKGASRMATQQVIVKRLSSIENLGSMNVLCSDKTGTLTEGTVKVDRIINVNGQLSSRAGLLSKINAQLQQGFHNPIDVAILAFVPDDISAYPRIDEIPYDFIRKRLTILTEINSQLIMVTKGAPAKHPRGLSICGYRRDYTRPTGRSPGSYSANVSGTEYKELSNAGAGH